METKKGHKMLSVKKLFAKILFAAVAPTMLIAQGDLGNFKLTKTCTNCNFTGANLPLSDFSGGEFSNSLFTNAMLQNANFSGSTLTRVVFDGADLRGVNFSGSSHSGMSFMGSDLRGADFTRSVVDRYGFMAGNGVNFKLADLRGANFSNSYIHGGVFRGAELSSANFSNAVIHEFRNTEATSECPESHDKMVHRNANFSGIRNAERPARETKLEVIGNFDAADFSGAMIYIMPPWGGACELSFTNSKFDGATIQGRLTGSNLSGSSFVNAKISADFSQTNLEDVDFTGADLAGSNFQGARFCGTVAPDGTIMFDGC